MARFAASVGPHSLPDWDEPFSVSCAEPAVTPVIPDEAGDWIIVLRGRVPDSQTGSVRQFDWCGTREGWTIGAGMALTFETAQSARSFVSRTVDTGQQPLMIATS
jgi:hypothetical protein